MYVNVINYKTRRQNIIIDLIMNLNHSFLLLDVKVIVKLKLNLLAPELFFFNFSTPCL